MASITVRIDDAMRQKLDEASTGVGVSTSEYVRQILEAHIRVESHPESQETEATETSLSLTRVERRILQQLHQIYIAVNSPKGSSEYDEEYEKDAIKVLEHGFVVEYDHREFGDIWDEMPSVEARLVWNILDMFRVIHFSVERLAPDGQGWAQLGLETPEHFGKFRGFDLNDEQESRMLDYVRFLVEDGRWTEQSDVVLLEGGPEGNSHAPMLSQYTRMLHVFQSLWRKTLRGQSRDLSVESIRAILIAGGASEAL